MLSQYTNLWLVFSSLYRAGFISSTATFYSWQTLPTWGQLRAGEGSSWCGTIQLVQLDPLRFWNLCQLHTVGCSSASGSVERKQHGSCLSPAGRKYQAHRYLPLVSLEEHNRAQGLLPTTGAGHDTMAWAFVVCHSWCIEPSPYLAPGLGRYKVFECPQYEGLFNWGLGKPISLFLPGGDIGMGNKRWDLT